jgi:hypothetical protein
MMSHTINLPTGADVLAWTAETLAKKPANTFLKPAYEALGLDTLPALDDAANRPAGRSWGFVRKITERKNGPIQIRSKNGFGVRFFVSALATSSPPDRQER